MARRYRCMNCGTDFVAETPSCARCGIDPATDPRAAGVIHPIATIHYDPPHPRIRFRGLGHRACDPTKHIGTGRGSGEPSVVNCEACRATPAFQAAVRKGALVVSFLESEDEVLLPPAGVAETGEGDCGCK
jgi:hypothetical protein